MMGCDDPGSEVLISESPNKKRKLSHTWELVRVGRWWVGVNTMMPNLVVEEAVARGRVEELAGYAASAGRCPTAATAGSICAWKTPEGVTSRSRT